MSSRTYSDMALTMFEALLEHPEKLALHTILSLSYVPVAYFTPTAWNCEPLHHLTQVQSRGQLFVEWRMDPDTGRKSSGTHQWATSKNMKDLWKTV